jgi:hypothetical protein
MLDNDGVRRLAIAVLQQAVTDLQGPIPEYHAALRHSWRGVKTSTNSGARTCRTRGVAQCVSD